MSRLIDKLVILILAITVLALLWKLLAKPQDGASPERRDPLNLAGFEERQNRFNREIEIEERLGKK